MKERKYWNEHVTRADNSRLITIAKDYKPEGRKKKCKKTTKKMD